MAREGSSTAAAHKERRRSTLLQSYCYSVSPASENTWETELIQETIDGPWCLTRKTNTPIHCVTQLKKKKIANLSGGIKNLD